MTLVEAGTDTSDKAIPQARYSIAKWRLIEWSALPALLCVPAIWIFVSSYAGIAGDAQIYMARALADLDPNGIGRDMMFTQDGQSAFSIFRLLANRIVGLFGLDKGALFLAVINIVVLFFAIASFASRFAGGRALGVLIICAGLLPCRYGFYPTLMAGREFIAVPRPLSEAFVLFALLALCQGRTLISLGMLALAALVHPIMALPGCAVVAIILGLRDRRWFVAIAVFLAIATGAALAGAPLFDRLFSVIDHDWRVRLEDRNPYLFIALWPIGSVAPLLVQTVTLIIAGFLFDGRRRAILLTTVVVGLCGVAATWLFGDVLSLLLVVQAQPWRALWLVAVLAMPAFGLCALLVPQRGSLGQIAIAFLSLAWLTFDQMPIAPIAALAALCLFVASGSRRPHFSPFFIPAVWICVFAVAIDVKWQSAIFFLSWVKSLPPVIPVTVNPFAVFGLLQPPLILLAIGWARYPRWRYESIVAACLLITCLSVTFFAWDGRSLAARRLESDVHDEPLSTMMASKPGEVLWLSGNDGWYYIGRPQWSNETQGGSIVFSRALAMQWTERTSTLVKLGFFDPNQLRPWGEPPKMQVPDLAAASIASLCSRPDAPSWIVAPLPAGHVIPEGVGGLTWRSPVKQAIGGVIDDKMTWSVFDTYAVVPCART